MFTIWFMIVVTTAMIVIPMLVSLLVCLLERQAAERESAVALLWGQRFGHIGWEDWSKIRGTMKRGR